MHNLVTFLSLLVLLIVISTNNESVQQIMESETEINIKIVCMEILLVVCASCCYIFVNPFTSFVTDHYLPQQYIFMLNEQLANLIRDYCVMHVERNDAEMDHACGYKRGVAGPNPIAKWRRYLKILELAALWQQAYRPSASVHIDKYKRYKGLNTWHTP